MADDVAGDLPVMPGLVVPADELRWSFSRSSGPGGQSVNTTDSRVEVRWDGGRSAVLSPTQRRRLLARVPHGIVVVVARRERSQWQNRRLARENLAERIRTAVAAPPAPRRPTRRTRGSNERRLEAKRRRSRTKQQRSIRDE